jgi:hypothetical protein
MTQVVERDREKLISVALYGSIRFIQLNAMRCAQVRARY